jgi:AcrR family transcriptional regulator
MPPRDRTKRRVSPTQDRALASIDAILTATELLLAEEGFARTNTNRIATRAGVNVALLYRYFAGKEAIVGALIERHAATTHAAVQQALADNCEQPLPVAVRALLQALVTTPVRPTLHRELVEQISISKRHEVVGALREQIAALFAEFLAKRESELRPLADPEATLFVMQHAIEAASHAACFYRPEELSLERTLDALGDLVVRTLSRSEVRGDTDSG